MVFGSVNHLPASHGPDVHHEQRSRDGIHRYLGWLGHGWHHYPVRFLTFVCAAVLYGGPLAPVCGAQEDAALRLQDGPTDLEGRLEIYHEGQWGTVCNDKFSRTDAKVACRQLGYAGGGIAHSGDIPSVDDSSTPIWLDEVECTGTEEHLAACPHAGWGNHNCFHFEDVGVSCDPNRPSAPANLMAEASHESVTLSWDAPNNDGGSNIIKYQYLQKEGTDAPGDWMDIPGSGPNTTSYTVPNLTNGTQYTFKVRAVNGATPPEGAESDEATARPAASTGPPGGGGGGGGSGGDQHGNTRSRATPVSLGTAPWSASTPGRINTRSDIDYFRLPIPHDGVLVVETTGSTDTVGTVWQDGEELAMADSGGERRNFRLSVRVEAGEVVLAVAGSGNRTGAYTVVTTLVVGYLENPGPDSFQSGIGVISGWVCDVEMVEIELNDVVQEAAYGTERADTEPVCGDTDNGFGVLFNWNRLGDGVHTVVVRVNGVELGRTIVDGVELARATVTVTTLGVEFLRNVAGECVAEDFPTGGETVTLAWQEPSQNFVITGGSAPSGENMAGVAGRGLSGESGARLLSERHRGDFGLGVRGGHGRDHDRGAAAAGGGLWDGAAGHGTGV